MTHPLESSPRRWLLPTLPMAAVASIFGAISGTTLGMALPFAAVGLLWALAVGPFAARAAHKGAQSPAWANTPVLIACPLALLVLGGSMLSQAMSGTPEEGLLMLRQAAFGNFFVTFHLVFEWVLIPAMLMLNWHNRSRRKLLLALAIVFYLGRAWSAVYFAPTALAWIGISESEISPDLLDEVALWLNLNVVRMVAQDAVIATLLFVAVVRRPLAAMSEARPSVPLVQPQH